MSSRPQTTQWGPVSVVVHGQWAEIALSRPPANALDPTTVDALHSALDFIDATDEIGGYILRGRPKMFSAGLDVVALQPLDREAMRLFWQRFASLFMRLYATSKINIACIEGHAPAGGCVLAIACDYRVMASGPYKIGLNEVAVGLAVPGWLTEVYVDLIGRRYAERALQLGEMMIPERAHALGLVDEVVPMALAMDRACAELNLRLKSPPLARGLTKTALRATRAEHLNQRQQADLEPLLDVWFADECRSVMAALVARLKG